MRRRYVSRNMEHVFHNSRTLISTKTGVLVSSLQMKSFSKAEIMAEEVLILLEYAFDLFSRPTFQNWDQSYECWLSRNGLLKRVRYLEAQKFLLREGKSTAWVYQLTKRGRVVALGGRDPVEHWQRPWDGVWRLFVFDLPLTHQRARKPLLRWLRQRGFGYLQDSVWINPHPVNDIAESLKPFHKDVESFTILESRCALGFSDRWLVRGAWSFDEIDRRYRAYLQAANLWKRRLEGAPLHPRELFPLLREERKLWVAAVCIDPLLPKELWPHGYVGYRAWQMRSSMLKLTTRHVQPE